MRAIGIFLLFLAGMFTLAALGVDHLDPSTIRGGLEGARSYQQTAIMIALGLFLGGVILLVARK